MQTGMVVATSKAMTGAGEGGDLLPRDDLVFSRDHRDLAPHVKPGRATGLTLRL